ncbi:unnamed protein product [Lactuca saligna]|uniref:Uncharacterized protein n=1 Tax=Lactuca saligna TaxID=75948 RepID=A0AA35ZEP7_LACSI|nr:unnamed protein product [Lactuca saligna]
MSIPSSSSISTAPTTSQLVFALTNVYSQFSCKLFVDGFKYKLLKRISQDMYKGAKVYGHINAKSLPKDDDEFCHSLKNLDEALANCDSKSDEIELIMQILHQLPPSYHIILDIITNIKCFPSFLKAKNMLLLHESREESIDPTSDSILTSSAALFSSAPTNGKSKNKFNKVECNERFASKGGGSSNVSASSNFFFPVTPGVQGQNHAYFRTHSAFGSATGHQLGLLGLAPPPAVANAFS